jgi:hypothetical protein
MCIVASKDNDNAFRSIGKRCTKANLLKYGLLKDRQDSDNCSHRDMNLSMPVLYFLAVLGHEF